MQLIMKEKKGFTLVEIMVSMVIGGLVMAGIYGVYSIQQRTYTVQEQMSEMQQKGRAALAFLVQDIRMAGWDSPDGTCPSGDVSLADPQSFAFETCDTTSNTTVTITYGLYDAYISSGNNNGIVDDLFRQEDTGQVQLIAEGVDAIEFLYRVEIPKNPSEFSTKVAATSLQYIRSVQISMLMRATYPDPRYTDTTPYTLASGATWTPPNNDHYHRRFLITRVKLRNMGLAGLGK